MQRQCACGRGPMCGHGEPCNDCIKESWTKPKYDLILISDKKLNNTPHIREGLNMMGLYDSIKDAVEGAMVWLSYYYRDNKDGDLAIVKEQLTNYQYTYVCGHEGPPEVTFIILVRSTY